MSSSKNTKVDLRLDWCSYEAAKYACEHWHYSGCVPAGKNVFIGIWEDRKYIGCLIFGWGANRNMGSPYGLKQPEVCELTRVALATHKSQVTRIIAIGLKLLRKQSPGLMLCISYADTGQNHHGGIYQGGGWIYVGVSMNSQLRIKGQLVHKKTVRSRYGREDVAYIRKNVDPTATWENVPGKHKYLYPLSCEMRDKILPLAKPYPKRANDE